MSTIYTRTADYVEFGSARRSAKLTAELNKIAAAIASLLVDPTFTGDARAITRAVSDNSTLLATTEFVQTVLGTAGALLPVQTGHGGPPQEFLRTNGTTCAWEPLDQQPYTIFDAATVTLQAVSALEVMENSVTATGLATACYMVIYGNSLFIAGGGQNAGAYVASSADGLTWTLRAMPSSQAWYIGTDGSQFVATVSGATTTATSTNGTTWSGATALPGSAKVGFGLPVFQGSTCFVLSNTAGAAYTSTDYGTSWSSQTLPANAGSQAPFVVGGLIWYWTTGTTAYTSATGATGSWTSRTLPFTPNDSVWQDFDGALIGRANAGTQLYRTTDGINWTTMTIGVPSASCVVRTINGVYAQFATTFGNAATRHDGAWVRRYSNVSDQFSSIFRVAKNGGSTVYLIPHQAGTAGEVGRIAPAEGTATTAIFTS